MNEARDKQMGARVTRETHQEMLDFCIRHERSLGYLIEFLWRNYQDDVAIAWGDDLRLGRAP